MSQLSLNDKFKRRRPAMLDDRSDSWVPKKGLLRKGKGVNIVGAWDLDDFTFEDLSRRLMIFEHDCYYETKGLIMPRVTTPCLEWLGFEQVGPWRRGRCGEMEYGLGQFDRTGFTPMHQLAYRIAGFPLYVPKLGQPKRELAHTCDNKKCCNPLHLSWKTSAQNKDDIRISKEAGDYTQTPYALTKAITREIKKELAAEPTTVEGFFNQFTRNTSTTNVTKD